MSRHHPTGPIEEVCESEPMGWVARAGLSARAVVYGLMGVLTLVVARGSDAKVDQKGALAQVMTRPLGAWLVGLLAAGFAGYSLWRLSEAAFGAVGEGKRAGPRVQSGVRAVVYAFLAVSALSVLLGSREDQGAQQRDVAARLMAHTGGRWLLGVAGVVIAVVGLVMVWEGLTTAFMRFFPVGAVSTRLRKAIRHLGRVGTVARGLVFALTGSLVVAAAWTFDAAKASGLDGALKTLRNRPYGGWMLAVMGVGLLAFSLYGLSEARYRRV